MPESREELERRVADLLGKARHNAKEAELSARAADLRMSEIGAALIDIKLLELEPPPPITPPPVEAGEFPTFPDETPYGCPPDMELVEWVHDQNTGAGCPAGVRWSINESGEKMTAYHPELGRSNIGTTRALLEGFQLKPSTPGKSTDKGYASGVSKGCPLLIVRHARVLGMNKWGRNGGIEEERVERVSFIGTFPEHDSYIKPRRRVGYSWIYSRDTGSQGSQVRLPHSEDPEGWEIAHEHGDTISVWHWLAINHGGGDRESQLWKVFSAEAPGGGWSQMPFDIDMGDLWLDDSMRPTCMGALYIGGARSWKVDGLVARGGALLQHAVSIREDEGPVEIRGLALQYTSGEEGRGVKIDDPDRPVKIHPGLGNLLIRDHNGKRLASVREGYEQHWSGA